MLYPIRRFYANSASDFTLLKSIFNHLRQAGKHRPSGSVALLIEAGESLYVIKRFIDDQVIAELFEVPDIPEHTTIRDDLAFLGQRTPGTFVE